MNSSTKCAVQRADATARRGRKQLGEDAPHRVPVGRVDLSGVSNGSRLLPSTIELISDRCADEVLPVAEGRRDLVAR
jgi:hypothetical protein